MELAPTVENLEIKEPPHTGSWVDHPLFIQTPWITWGRFVFSILLVLALVSRFAGLGNRVISFDETNHVVPSYSLSQGQGYQYDPLTHGPFQFHAISLSYFLFGASDFTARIPAALFSIATVFFIWFLYRRYLGQTGALIASLLALISPFMLFYGRYARDEAIYIFAGLIMLYAILRYLETGRARYLYLLTVATAFHFIIMETTFIYTAEALILLGILFLTRVLRRPWKIPAYRSAFLFALGGGLVLVGAALSINLVKARAAMANPLALLVGGLGILLCIAGIYYLIKGFSMPALSRERTFDLIVLLLTLVMPQLSPLLTNLAGWNPLDYSTIGVLHTALFLLPLAGGAILIGYGWNPQLWPACAALFYAIFVTFYTTFFTNGTGLLSGMVGALGYWMSQQAVQRGSQPFYYYALIQVPLYEYLSAIGALLALALALRHPHLASIPEQALPGQPEPPEAPEPPVDSINENGDEAGEALPLAGASPELQLQPQTEQFAPAGVPVLFLLLGWTALSFLFFTLAGEKMPWLTINMSLGLVLTAGWAFGWLVDTTPWRRLPVVRAFLALVVLAVFLAGLGSALNVLSSSGLLGPENASTFVVAVAALVAGGIGLMVLTRDWPGGLLVRGAAILFLALLAVQTARTSYRAAFVNADNAKEYLVYAHSARGPKDVLAEITTISQRTTGGLDIAVAYDNDSLYPFWWYLREFPSKVYYADKATPSLANEAVILVGESNYNQIAPIVGNNYQYYQTTRLWWPNQDYFNLTWNRVLYAITNPQMRTAIWNIWFNRDYTLYAQITKNANLTLATWQPSRSMRIYVRKDIAAQMWK